MGDGFIKWIKVLDAQPLAAVITNGLRSANFVFQGRCRQTPLLFVLAIERLAESIRQDNLMNGLDQGGKSHKFTLYADNVLLLLRNPSLSVPRLS